MWVYEQATGVLRDPKGDVLTKGYSGSPEGKNDPVKEHIPEVGPIPRGKWKITALRLMTLHRGPYVLTLEPLGDTHGRSAFLIHGDSISKPGTASKGCIILQRWAREAIWKSGDRDLEVV